MVLVHDPDHPRGFWKARELEEVPPVSPWHLKRERLQSEEEDLLGSGAPQRMLLTTVRWSTGGMS